MQGSGMFSAGHFPKLISDVLFTPENLLYFPMLTIPVVLEIFQNFSLHPHFTKRLKWSNFLLHEILQAALVQIDPLWNATRQFYPSVIFLCSQKHWKSTEIHTHPHLRWLTAISRCKQYSGFSWSCFSAACFQFSGNYLLYFDFIFRMEQ